MSVQGKYSLSVGHKTKLRSQIITGARNYNKYLVNKIFKIICEDGVDVDIRFFASDFKHMTGLYSNLDDEAFYQRCLRGTIDVGNIDTNQKYNWSTLRVREIILKKSMNCCIKTAKKHCY